MAGLTAPRLLLCIFLAFFLLALSGPFAIGANLPVDGNNALENTDSISKARKHKVTALLLTATMGMIGVHRLYLGTKPWVPVFYLLTFGGVFFVLPLVDFFVIAFSKNLLPFKNNSAFLMWLNKYPQATGALR